LILANVTCGDVLGRCVVDCLRLPGTAREYSLPVTSVSYTM
jgi:hypothetical protein